VSDEAQIARMVQSVRAIADPVERAVALQKLQDAIGRARRDVSLMRGETFRELRGLIDGEHPEGWSLTEIAELVGLRARSSAQYIAEGRGVSRAAAADGATSGDEE